MSYSNHQFADKENALRHASTRKHEITSKPTINEVTSKSNIINENTFRISKQHQQPNKPASRRARVPLGGKDQNKGFPVLQRSQSGIQRSQSGMSQSGMSHLGMNRPSSAGLLKNMALNTSRLLPNRPPQFQQPQQHASKFTRKPLTTNTPVLRKANSSLGFSHHLPLPHDAAINERRLAIKKANPLQNNIFKPDNANAAPTDSLLKKSNPISLPKIQSLASTFSSNTHRLHASNIVNRDIHQNNVDPIKSAKPPTKKPLTIPQHLIDDESSIELTPLVTPPLPDRPHLDVPQFTNDELHNLRDDVVPKQTQENFYHHPDIKQNEIKLKFENIDLDKELVFDNFDNEPTTKHDELDLSNQPQPEDVGLTVDELNSLLDF